jgi:hypothetical protein
MAEVPIDVAERLFSAHENDSPPIVCRSLGFSWTTTRELVVIRLEGAAPDHLLRTLFGHFETLSSTTARHVLRFLRMREAAAASA